MDNRPAISIKDLTKRYAPAKGESEGKLALKGVSFDVPQGGIFGLLGPNGAGKSTLMRTIATLQAPTSGHIRFGDIDVLKHPEELRKTLGYLPQDFGVYPRVSAYDMLDHMAVLKGIAGGKERKETVENLLNQVNLWDVRKKAWCASPRTPSARSTAPRSRVSPRSVFRRADR